jgi:hypothetical protein
VTDLFALLPAVYRIRDAAQGDPLRALLEVIGNEVQRVSDDIEDLYDNWFIETCAEWVVPYIGDLLGVRPLTAVESASVSQRGYVANTIGYRRRKGTAAVLEELARDVTGWPAVAVEFFARLATTAHTNHVRLTPPAIATVRDAAAMEYVGTPFETLARTADMRHIDNGRGRHNISHVGLFLWRLQAYPLVGVSPKAVDDRRFFFDPLGLDRELFAEPADNTGSSSLPEPQEVPHPISRLELHRAGRGVNIVVAGAVQPNEVICSCDLSDSGGDWAHTAPPGKIAVDPVLGRLAFAGPPAGPVTVGYAVGFPGDLGGGPYDRRAALAAFLAAGVTWQMGVVSDPPANEVRVVATLADAVAAWNGQPSGTRGVIVVMDSVTRAADVTINLPEGSHLLIAAGQWPEEPTGDALNPLARRIGRVVPSGVRPHLRGTVAVHGTDPEASPSPGSLTLDGLLLDGALDVAAGNLRALRLSHCTVAPGLATIAIAENHELELALERSVVGTLDTSTSFAAVALVDTIVAGDLHARALSITASTVLGVTAAETIEATDSIFIDTVTIERRQVGCVRFSYVTTASTTPRRYRCAPAPGTTVRPAFVSTSFGHSAFAQLSPVCPDAIARGAEDGGEMGAWHFLHSPQRLDNLRRALDEYLRFGLEAGSMFAPQ